MVNVLPDPDQNDESHLSADPAVLQDHNAVIIPTTELAADNLKVNVISFLTNDTATYSTTGTPGATTVLQDNNVVTKTKSELTADIWSTGPLATPAQPPTEDIFAKSDQHERVLQLPAPAGTQQVAGDIISGISVHDRHWPWRPGSTGGWVANPQEVLANLNQSEGKPC